MPWSTLGWSITALGGLLVLFAWLRSTRLFWRRRPRRCAKCRYDMAATEGLRCPECGYEPRHERGLHRAGRRRLPFVLGAIVILAGDPVRRIPDALERGWAGLVPTSVLVAGVRVLPTPDADAITQGQASSVPPVLPGLVVPPPTFTERWHAEVLDRIEGGGMTTGGFARLARMMRIAGVLDSTHRREWTFASLVGTAGADAGLVDDRTRAILDGASRLVLDDGRRATADGPVTYVIDLFHWNRSERIGYVVRDGETDAVLLDVVPELGAQGALAPLVPYEGVWRDPFPEALVVEPRPTSRDLVVEMWHVPIGQGAIRSANVARQPERRLVRRYDVTVETPPATHTDGLLPRVRSDRLDMAIAGAIDGTFRFDGGQLRFEIPAVHLATALATNGIGTFAISLEFLVDGEVHADGSAWWSIGATGVVASRANLAPQGTVTIALARRAGWVERERAFAGLDEGDVVGVLRLSAAPELALRSRVLAPAWDGALTMPITVYGRHWFFDEQGTLTSRPWTFRATGTDAALPASMPPAAGP